MDPVTITALSGAIVAVLGAITATIVALRPILLELLLEMRKNTAVTIQAASDAQDAAEVSQQTHDMVDGQRSAAVEQQARTDNLLRAVGVPIPFNPAVEYQVPGTEKKPEKEGTSE